MLYLHGFPKGWFGWRKQLTFFSECGYRTIAPDQRGYNRSDKPAGKQAYTLDKLVDDMAELIRQLTSGKVNLTGHDWGGAVAWTLADKYPDLVEKLIVLNMPHPEIMQQHLGENRKQMLRSWYAVFFSYPFCRKLF